MPKKVTGSYTFLSYLTLFRLYFALSLKEIIFSRFFFRANKKKMRYTKQNYVVLVCSFSSLFFDIVANRITFNQI
ncbi:uncharacterized protein B0P05DRAFT_546560 [Gilbertella persicaria]|uniref:uncharacterized protein n=1 Tax=Gilbertella persicaria TaxID=101096 RepID=UPI00221EFD9A|nr:uncharacterized protein B0P05DRAFT_546560 [Gilbertella persicaria]KAI8075826.1 hypothetical protein B0P05DRAFT_546560 [Gilbertella persicaria]